MGNAIAMVSRYRWELAPLLILLAANWANYWPWQLAVGRTFTGMLYLSATIALAVGTFHALRQGRPLLVALWVLALTRAASGLTLWGSIAMGLSPSPLAFWLATLPTSVAVTLLLATWVSRRRSGQAFMVAAVFLTIWYTSAIAAWTAPFIDMMSTWELRWFFIGSAGHVLSWVAIAVAVAAFDRGQLGTGWIPGLLLLPLAMSLYKGLATSSTPLWYGATGIGPRGLALAAEFLAVAVVTFALVWLFTRRRMRPTPVETTT